jgi:hypothetical protein
MKVLIPLFVSLLALPCAFAGQPKGSKIVYLMDPAKGHPVPVVQIQGKYYATYVGSAADTAWPKFTLPICKFNARQSARYTAKWLCKKHGGKDCRLKLTTTQVQDEADGESRSCMSSAYVYDRNHPTDVSSPVSHSAFSY